MVNYKSMTVTFFSLVLFFASGLTSVTAGDEHAASAKKKGERWRIDSGSKWEDYAAYSRAVIDGRWIFVSGTVGFNPEDSSIPEDFDAQMDQIFKNLERTLKQADSDLGDIVQLRSYLVDTKYVDAMAAKLREYLGDVRPTNTTIITDLAAEGALIEIEITALRQRDDAR